MDKRPPDIKPGEFPEVPDDVLDDNVVFTQDEIDALSGDDSPDALEDIFRRQECTMEELRLRDKCPEWPLDITTKGAQRLIKENIFNACEELFEASYTLKNKAHRQTDVRVIDRAHYVEELGDALAFFLEVCIFSGITPQELYEEFCRKNALVIERIKAGY